MKSINKYEKSPERKVPKKSGDVDKQGFSPADKAKMITEAIKQTGNCIESIMSYLSEREKTRQVEVECFTRIVESNNELEEVREKEVTKRMEISAKSLIEIEKLNNEKEKIRLLKVCLNQTITTMNELKLIYNETSDRSLIEMIHQQNLRLLDVSKTINVLH